MLWLIPADLHDQRIGDMCIFFSVILSEAKACPERSRRDLIAACHGHEILRFAQDDNGNPRPVTSVSATKVSLRRSAIPKSLAEIAEIPIPPGHSLHPPPALVLDPQPHVWRAFNGGDDGG
jgi:hypothetical protein